ncbi:hypothetical protein QN277_022411 [Acacia crassicarpa]|uniref:beta-galactosidase n=1 Tax=Acacia crassicarpa TaxID=499986 RepID=A0AAE1K9S9_9FABA|nr:hypothetical protein QN277_022411 [Acacia crassicarpa]
MLRPGPYMCAEWDLGGFPACLLAMDPSPKLRSSDPTFLRLVDGWWSTLLPKLVPLLYDNGGPIIMVQIENEFGSYGNDQAYLHHLVNLARDHLGHDVILYTTDGGSRYHLERGTIRGAAVFSGISTDTHRSCIEYNRDDPWPIFKVQKEFNAPGKSPPLPAEFYTGWLTHWGESIAATDADFTAAALEKILQKNGSAVLYVAHGGTNFGFFNGANTGQDEADYKADITFYDYDAPIRESGDVDNAKFNALRKVIAQYSSGHLPSDPSDNGKAGYGPIHLQKKAFLFDMVDLANPSEVIESENPLSMESVGQMFGFLLYMSKYTSKGGRSNLSIPKVHDRAQVFISCPSNESGARPTYVGTLERKLNNNLILPETECSSNINLYILVENMGRLNYGDFIFDRKGILSSVYLDVETLHGWKMLPIPFHNLNELPSPNPITQSVLSTFSRMSTGEDKENTSQAPAIYSVHFSIDKSELIKDTFISFDKWGKGIAFVNEYNLGRYWPSKGPQGNLYVPAPLLKQGDNTLVIFELESPNLKLVVHSVNQPNFTCGSPSSQR